MRTASNIIARIILFVVGGLIILAAALEIIAAVKVLNDPAVGWWNFGNQDSLNAMILILIGALDAIIGLTYLGKKSPTSIL